MHRQSPHNAKRVARTLACAAVALPVLLVAGCGSDSSSGGGEDKAAASSGSQSASPSLAPVKFKKLPDACGSLSKGTVKDLVPGTDNAGGKRIGSGDTGDSGTCLWSGLEKYDYRQLTVSMKRFDSDTARGSGDSQATAYLKQQTDDVKSDKSNKDVKTANVSGAGDQATRLSYDAKKKDKKDSEDYHEELVVARSHNVVVTVDYEGAGFEDAKTPSSDDLSKGAEKAAAEAVKQLK